MDSSENPKRNSEAWREARDSSNNTTMASSKALQDDALTDITPEAKAKSSHEEEE